MESKPSKDGLSPSAQLSKKLQKDGKKQFGRLDFERAKDVVTQGDEALLEDRVDRLNGKLNVLREIEFDERRRVRDSAGLVGTHARATVLPRRSLLF